MHRWFRHQINTSELIEDDSGKAWYVTEILRVQPKYIVTICVECLWQQNQLACPWGDNQLSLQTAYDLILKDDYLILPTHILLHRIMMYGGANEHLCRIALFVTTLRYGQAVKPLIIRSDGLLLDGYHRLVAYRLLSFQTVSAWCIPTWLLP
jgi:hypothetical protein